MNQFKEEKDNVHKIFAGVILIVLLFMGLLLYMNWDRWTLVQAVKSGHIPWDVEMTDHINMVCQEADVTVDELTFIGIIPQDEAEWVYFVTPVDVNCFRTPGIRQVWRRNLELFDN